MHKLAVGYAVGKLMQLVGLTMLAPLAIALYDHWPEGYASWSTDVEVIGFASSVLFAILAGSILVAYCRSGKNDQGIREGYAIVTIGWLLLTLVGAIPFWLYFMTPEGGGHSALRAFTDAYFEIMSGFTTTGATILADIEGTPRSLLFLRALTHWLGGMGIITLAIVIFPAMGVSGYQMFRGEVPGPTKDRLQPRLAQTASVLWGVYMLFSLAETFLLMVGGMNLFDAICHTFATMATGGFSTKNASVAGYNDFIQWVLIVFMYFAGINFLLHFKALRGDTRALFRNPEFKFYTAAIVLTIIVSTVILQFNGLADIDHAASSYRTSSLAGESFVEHYSQQEKAILGLNDTFRHAAFTTVSIITTTGFATLDFDLWPDFLRFLMVFLMFFGGMAGSTGGGMKIVRVMVVFKVAFTELRKLTQPRLVAPVKVGGEALDDDRVINIVSFALLFVGLFVVTALLMTIFIDDLTTAITCSIATIGNIGPGLAGVGSVESYGWIPAPGKWVLIFSMLLGRLEIFTVLIVLRASVWRK